MTEGEGSFWCLRCESSHSQGVLSALSDLKAGTMSGLEGNLEVVSKDG